MFEQFKQWAKQVDKKVRREAKISFSDYTGITSDRPINRHVSYALTPEQYDRVQQLSGPYGRALFYAWVAQRDQREINE